MKFTDPGSGLSRRIWAFAFAQLILSQFFVSSGWATIGPENVVVVVNAKSIDSRTIANHYVHLRKIPSSNVILLDSVPGEMVTTLEKFREQILRPVLETLDERKLSNHVDAIVYSAGFPYAVRVKEHAERLEDEQAKKVYRGIASINGLTYLYRFVLADSENYLSTAPNQYARLPWDRYFVNPFNGELGEAFTAAETALQQEQFSDAAKAFDELLELQPLQAPLAILAASALAQAGDADGAILRLRKAAELGWSSGRWLERNDDFKSLKDREDFQELIRTLGDAPAISQHAVAFRGSRGWARNGWQTDPGNGISYLTSCMLAVTRSKGTTVEEAIEYLKRSSSVDHSFPEGTVYLTKTSDVRTKTRFPQFAEAMLYLKWLGREVEVIRDVLPRNQKDVIGLTFGKAKYDWPSSGSEFLPGAIGDNLTSTSGVMTSEGQTKLTELLKAGAAIASGTVTEPYALQFKFPLPTIHAFYAEGLSAIEAYYAAIANPYQMLIVGDPLCQPFARQPAELISGSLGKVNGEDAVIIQLKENDTAPSADQVSPLTEMEVYIDGRLLSRTPKQETIRIKLGSLPGGAYELRVVLVGDARIAPRKTIQTWFEAPGLLTTPVASIVSVETTKSDSSSSDSAEGEANAVARVMVKANGADTIKLTHFGELVGELDSDQGEIEIELGPLGDGPIQLRPTASFRGTAIPGREITIER